MASPLILVVDDDRATATFLVTVLEDAGYQVLAATGEAALRLAQERTPALVLLDRRMPGIDGREMARRLRADPTTTAIPLVLMTADAHDREELAAAVDGWLAKPFHLATLFATVGNWAPLT
jgi:CheY-like chemotaxis protein